MRPINKFRDKPIVDFEELLTTQSFLQMDMGHPTGTGEPGAKENLLALIVEATEALDEINWKPWKMHIRKPVNREALATELTDILQFWANTALAMGFGPVELSQVLRRKWNQNWDRIDKNEVTNKEDLV